MADTMTMHADCIIRRHDASWSACTDHKRWIDTRPVPAAVFGPDRPAAAIRAIAELQAASESLTGYSDYDTPAMRERYRIARANRAQYYEYGDTFTGH